MRIGMSLLVNVSPMCRIVVPLHIGMRILGNVFPIPFVLPLLCGMHVSGNVFTDRPLALPVRIGMKVVEYVSKRHLLIHSAIKAMIVAFLHEGIKVSNETF